MRELEIRDGSVLEKWITQNKGFIQDVIEGSLLDNFIVSCKRGIAFVWEKGISCDRSVYEVQYFRDDETSGIGKAYLEWNELFRDYYQLINL